MCVFCEYDNAAMFVIVYCVCDDVICIVCVM